jgi:hypothetical protein
MWNVTLCGGLSVSPRLNGRSFILNCRRRMIPTSDSWLVLLSVAQLVDEWFAFTGVLLNYLYQLTNLLWRLNDKFWQYSFKITASFNMHITYLSFAQMSGCDKVLYVITIQRRLFLSSLKMILSAINYVWIYSLLLSYSLTVCGANI